MTTSVVPMVDTMDKPASMAQAVEWLHSRSEKDARYYELRVQ